MTKNVMSGARLPDCCLQPAALRQVPIHFAAADAAEGDFDLEPVLESGAPFFNYSRLVADLHRISAAARLPKSLALCAISGVAPSPFGVAGRFHPSKRRWRPTH